MIKKKPITNKKTENTRPNKSNKIYPGQAIRSRDEFFLGGIEKDNHKNKPKDFYRVGYVVETNNLDEIAIVKSTASKGHKLKSNPNKKFKDAVYTKDNKGKAIKISPPSAKDKKFVRSSKDDVTKEDAEYMLKRISKHPKDNELIKELKSRKKVGSNTPDLTRNKSSISGHKARGYKK